MFRGKWNVTCDCLDLCRLDGFDAGFALTVNLLSLQDLISRPLAGRTWTFALLETVRIVQSQI